MALAFRHLAIPTAIVAIAFAVRIVGIGQPDDLVFDEVYYVQDACWYLYESPTGCGGITAETSRGHPPLGKWFIAAGIRVFGYHPLGWRITTAVAGALTVLATYALSRRLLQSTLASALAAILLTFDLLHFVHSRVAMLDGFLTLFGVASLYFAVRDRDDLVRRDASGEGFWRMVWRPWRLAAGGAAGLALATKWPGLSVIVAVAYLTIAWERRVRKASQAPRPTPRVARLLAWSLVLSFVAVPAMVYAVTHLGSVHGGLVRVPWETGSFVRALLHRQLGIVRYHRRSFGDHPYQSPAWSWPLLKRPIVYFFNSTPTTESEILAVGNPAVWWAGIAAIVHMSIGAARRRDALAPELPLTVAIVATYGPWLVLAPLRSFVFLYYFLPTVPFVCVALAYTTVAVRSVRTGRALSAILMAAAVGGFVYYHPVVTAVPMTPDALRARLRPFIRCGLMPGAPVPEPSGDGSRPPEGWCWI